MWLDIAEKVFKVREVKVQVRFSNRLRIVWYNYILYSFSLDGAISCVQMCECYNCGGINFIGAGFRAGLTIRGPIPT